LAAKAAAASRCVAAPFAPRLGEIDRIAEPNALGLADGQGRLGAPRDPVALLLGQGGIQVQHERIGFGAELGHNERNLAGP
jgi:hypothetical protein